MKRLFLIAVLLLLLTGCGSDEEEDSEQEASKYLVDNPGLKGDLSLDMNRSGNLIALEHSEVNLSQNARQDFIYAVSNPTNKTDICIYSQFKCRTVLKGEVCDSAAGMQDTGYYWRWFKTPKTIFVRNQSTVLIRAELEPKGSSNTYLGELVVWKADVDDRECPDIHFFNEREGIQRYADTGFMLTVD